MSAASLSSALGFADATGLTVSDLSGAATKAAEPKEEQVATDVKGVTESDGGRRFNVHSSARLDGVKDARRVLDLIKPAHASFNFESTFVGLGEDGVRCLLEGLRDRSRSTTGEWAHFSVDAFFLAVMTGHVDNNGVLEVDEDYNLFRTVSAWCLPLVIHTLFDNPADFPDLRMLGLGVHWPTDSASIVRRVILDPRLQDVWLDYSAGSLSILSCQLQAILDRIPAQPRSLDRIGLISLLAEEGDENGPPLDDLENLVLEIVRAGQDGLSELGALRHWFFFDDDRRAELVVAAMNNNWLQDLTAIDLDDPEVDSNQYNGSILPELDVHLSSNAIRNEARKDALLSIVVPARVLLFARNPSLGQILKTSSVTPRVTLLSLPPEVISIILHSLANINASDYARKHAAATDPPSEPPSDVTVDPREIQDRINFASDLTTLHRKRGWGWTGDLLWERRKLLASKRKT